MQRRRYSGRHQEAQHQSAHEKHQFHPRSGVEKNIGPIKLEHVKTQDHSAPLSAAEVDTRVEAYFHTHESISRAILQGLFHFTSIIANRHLHRLQEEGKIKNINWKHQPIYI